MDSDWDVIDITTFGGPTRYIVNVLGGYELVRRLRRSFVTELWGEWEWSE